MSSHRFDTSAVVLGMHRSGTSALAGILAVTGFTAPKTLLPANAVNERGFWESEKAKVLNDALFAELGTTWHSLDTLTSDTLSEERKRSARSRARAVLEQEFDEGAWPLIKDPRLCRLLPLWQPALSDLSARTVYPIIIRNPLEVGRSLSQRNEFDVDLACLLWARYYLDAEFHTRGLPRVFLNYDDLIEGWRGSLTALSVALETTLQLTPLTGKKVDDFLSAGLRHHSLPSSHALVELERLPVVHGTYKILLEWSQGRRAHGDDQTALDAIRGEFDAIGKTVSRVVENARLDRKRLSAAREQVESASAELSRTQKTVETISEIRTAIDGQTAAQSRFEDRLDSLLASLKAAIEERAVLEGTLSELIIDKANERSAHQRMLEEARNECTSLQNRISNIEAEAKEERALAAQGLADALEFGRQEREKFEARISETLQVREALSRELEQARAEHAREQQAREALSRQLEQARAEHAREQAALTDQHERTLSVLQEEQAKLVTELKDVKRKYRSTQHQLERDREKLRRTRELLNEVEANLARIRQSMPWRSYSVVREALHRGGASIRRQFGAGDRRRRVQQLALIRDSALFDPEWYLTRYPDVAEARVDPALHFLESGWREGRDPGPSFSASGYLKSNADVARAGVNPLLHFIEFGYSEGRNITKLSRVVSTSSEPPDEFGPAAAVASFPVRESEPIRWLRAARLSETINAVTIGGLAIGFAPESKQRSLLVSAFNRLAVLSGYSVARPDDDQASPANESQPKQLLDAWFVGNGRMRSRWTIEEQPIVVRGYQHNPLRHGALALIAEGLTVSGLDLIDANLANPYFPILFVISDPDGTVRNVELLAFPSLCRGGYHYAELLAFSGSTDSSYTEPLDLLGISNSLAANLLGIVDRSARPLVQNLAVSCEGADGTEPLFQPDFQAWLTNVQRISIEPLDEGKPNLLATAELPANRRSSGGTIILSPDVVPCIGLMTTHAAPGEHKNQQAILPLIFASADPSRPATLADVPVSATPALLASAPDFPPNWIVFVPEKESVPAEHVRAGAIRHSKSAPASDAELLTPVAPPALQMGKKDPSISWLVFPEDWDPIALEYSLRALALQDTTKGPALVLVGDVEDRVLAMARHLFPDLSSHLDVNAAIGAVESPLVGYLGANVLLHDARTSCVLAELLTDRQVLSASCVLVSTEKRGKHWQVTVADAGHVGTERGLDWTAVHSETAQLLWRSTYPTVRQPRDLWVSRSAATAGWLQRAGPLRPDEGIQVCTSMITASYLGARSAGPPQLRPPASAEVSAMRSKVLFG